ncbi:MAG TPA: amino acid adenylation domain-containing protein, partial [Thermoleophilaceae bacterium]|nr:amino acid adenylation domain-containing protein [Thermoleophilaceae bacterium]
MDALDSSAATGPADPVLIHRLFEAQADRTPGTPAIELAGAALRYDELDAAANRLAHRLAEDGAAPGSLVGICLERSIEMVVAVLAVLKSGAAYVPLDPTYPAERLGAMIEDCRPALVITAGALADGVSNQPGITIRLDEERTQLARQPNSRPQTAVQPDDPAYVIYTSGSTGTPKGVVVPHAGVGNLAGVVAHEFATTTGTRVLQFANFSFDAWVAELAMTLLVGGTLVLAPRERLADPDALHEVLAEGRIEVVTLPPSVLALLDPNGLPALRTVCAAGEACSWEVAERWRAPGRRFLNGYGPTEVTVAAAYHQVNGPRRADAVTVPIGAPLPGKHAYVLDDALEPVPFGEPGELVVGGAGIALGYLGRPELSAESFIRDPFSPDPDARAYRTGDLVRWLPDGVLEFLGRVDGQVKLHGFRIELGEIDAVLRAHAHVRDAVTAVREDTPGRPRLVAYVVGDPPPGDLRTHLRQQLPEWMVPGAIVSLERLPLTPNGKVDKRALPAPGRGSSPYVAPKTPLERAVADVFADVLGCESVGSDDSFFELGGDSLLATRAASRLAGRLAHELPVSLLFDAPTPAELAKALLVRIASERDGHLADQLERLSLSKRILLERKLLAAGRQAEVERIPRRSPDDPAPLSFAQHRLWFIDQLRPGEHTYNAALPMIIRGPVDGDALQQALDAVVERHEVMRTVYPVANDGSPRQVVLTDAHVELTRRDVSGLPREQRLPLALAELRAEGLRP